MKDKLIEVLSIQSYSHQQFRMFAYLIRQVKALGCSYYVYNGCIYVTKGDAINYPCVVAHMDTVHDIVEDLTVVEFDGKLTGFNSVTMEQTGIGGDDKVGVFVALQCLEHFDNIKVVFFRDEEVGCQGSYSADVDFFSDCTFVLQCDRRGYGDFVTNASGTELSSSEFQADILPIIKDYGYKFTTGMMTDVMALKESKISCSMANISCGYYNPHMCNEYVVVHEVLLVLEMVMSIISQFGGRYYHHEYSYKYSSYYGYNKSWKSYYKEDLSKDNTGWASDDNLDMEYESYRKGLPENKTSYTRGDMSWDAVGSLDYCDDCGESSGHFTYIRGYNIWACDRCCEYYKKEDVLI